MGSARWHGKLFICTNQSLKVPILNQPIKSSQAKVGDAEYWQRQFQKVFRSEPIYGKFTYENLIKKKKKKNIAFRMIKYYHYIIGSGK